MKRNVLSLGIAAVIGGLGFSEAAFAGIAYPTTDVGSAVAGVNATALGATDAATLVVNPNGIGHNLLVPYYTVQEGNATLLSIVNTDTRNGKAVKLRFRGAANSDDVFDFTLLMSPGDVWVAHVSKDAATGKAQIYTPDNTCTLPRRAVLNAAKFVTARVHGADDAAKAAQTLEGYVEIFNMADIPPRVPVGTAPDPNAVSEAGTRAGANPLFTAIGHTAAGTNPCSLAASEVALPAALKRLDADPVLTGITGPVAGTGDNAAADTLIKAANDRTALLKHGLWAPTTGLTGSWTILNITGASVAWSGNMTAIEARTTAGAAARGRVVFSPQKNDAVPVADINLLTADPLLRNTGAAPSTAIIKAAQYDLPDMSTPYLTATALAGQATAEPGSQATALTEALAVKHVINEYVTNPQISAATDWVFAMPTRRYAVGVDYKKVKTADSPLVFNADAATQLAASAYFTTTNTSMGAAGAPEYQACVQPGGDVTAYDQEEGRAGGEFVISPGTARKLMFCGEVSILTLNQTSALKAKIATKDIDAGFVNGWLDINTQGLTNLGLPIVGNSFVKMTGPLVTGKSTSFSITQPHRFTR